MSADGKFLVGRIEHGDAREITVYIANVATFTQGQTWRKAVDRSDEVTSFAVHDNALYLLTHKDAPRVLISNSQLVPKWATQKHFDELEDKGLMMYGQMTAGSWIYIGSQGIVQGKIPTAFPD